MSFPEQFNIIQLIDVLKANFNQCLSFFNCFSNFAYKLVIFNFEYRLLKRNTVALTISGTYSSRIEVLIKVVGNDGGFTVGNYIGAYDIDTKQSSSGVDHAIQIQSFAFTTTRATVYTQNVRD